jgi:hypothetical protein
MTSPYWTVMNDLDSTITNFIQVRDLVRDNIDDPKALDLAVQLLDHYIDKQDKAFQKAWKEVVLPQSETIQDKKYVAQYTEEELDAMCDAAEQESKEQIYKNYRAAIDEWNKLNEKYKELERCHEELQDLFYKVDGELDEYKVKYEQCQSNYHLTVKLLKELNNDREKLQ